MDSRARGELVTEGGQQVIKDPRSGGPEAATSSGVHASSVGLSNEPVWSHAHLSSCTMLPLTPSFAPPPRARARCVPAGRARPTASCAPD